MKSFIILDEPLDGFSVIVLSTGIYRPTEILSSVANELKQRKVAGRVLFDFLMSNGTRDNRYFWVNFDGNFERDLILKKAIVSEKIKTEITGCIKDNISEFNFSLLTPAMKFAIRKGITIG